MSTTTEPTTDSRSTASETLEAALAYAALGWPIYPVHLVAAGDCARCGPSCEWGDQPGHPVLDGSVLNDDGRFELASLGTTDEATIRRLWAETPSAAIGFTPTESVAVLDLQPQPKGKLLPWEQAWERLESTEQVRARVDYVLGSLDGIPSFTGPDGTHSYVMETSIPLASWSWSRCYLAGADSFDVMYLLPSSCHGWQSPPTTAACPERLAAAFSAESTEEPEQPVLHLDVQGFQALAASFEDIVDAAREVVKETGEPAPAHKIAKRLSGNNARKYQRIRQAALHPDCALEALDGPRDTPVYRVATHTEATEHAA